MQRDRRDGTSEVAWVHRGRFYLIERHVPSKAELDGLVAHYLAHAAELGRCPKQSDGTLSDA